MRDLDRELEFASANQSRVRDTWNVPESAHVLGVGQASVLRGWLGLAQS